MSNESRPDRRVVGERVPQQQLPCIGNDRAHLRRGRFVAEADEVREAELVARRQGFDVHVRRQRHDPL